MVSLLDLPHEWQYFSSYSGSLNLFHTLKHSGQYGASVLKVMLLPHLMQNPLPLIVFAGLGEYLGGEDVSVFNSLIAS